jgi:nucleoside-diphosphate-sugar epimerase
MSQLEQVGKHNELIRSDEGILVTGAAGFIGRKVVERLLERGFTRIRCFARPSSKMPELKELLGRYPRSSAEIFEGNLLSKDDCIAATEGMSVVIHLAAGRGEKSFPDAFMNSVVTTRNLLEACVHTARIRRFVNVSSFAVYSNAGKRRGKLLDENSPIELRPDKRGEAYCYAKTKQEELVNEYGERFGVPFVHIRPGAVYGPGNLGITARVGVGTFGLFLHLGGSNRIPFTYVDNCAEAIVLAALTPGVDREAFNVVDDDLPSSRHFLRLYKKRVKGFRSVYLPKTVSYLLCYAWERYSTWSQGQLPPAFNRSRWNSFWRTTRYSNQKLKHRLAWQPLVSTSEGLAKYFEACREKKAHA